MDLKFFFHIVIAIAWAQGALLLSVHLFRRNVQLANGLFALLLVTVLYVQSSVTLQALKPDAYILFYLGVYPVGLVTCSLVYIYTLAVLTPARVSKKLMALHIGVPFVFGVAWQALVHLYIGDPEILADGHAALDWTVIFRVSSVTVIMGSYIALSFKHLYRRESRPAEPVFRWLRFFLGGFLAVWVLLFVSNVTGIRGEQWLWVGIIHTSLMMGFGFYSLKHSSLIAGISNTSPKATKPKDPVKLDIRIQLLEQLMKKEKLYIKPGLKLSEVADGLGLRVQETSELINQGTGMSFYEYVNRHRIAEVKQRMAADECRHMSILAIALDCGFNSKSVFNEAFKQFEGTTPSEYRKNLGELSQISSS